MVAMSRDPVKILHILDSLGMGGMERVVIDVANGLDRNRFSQSVCCISKVGEAAKFLHADVRVIEIGKGEAADRLMPFKIARVIRDEKPDIVHTQNRSGIDTMIAGLPAKTWRLVHSEHGRNWPNIKSEPIKSRIARRLLYHFSDAVFTVSGELADYFCGQTGFPRSRMGVIPNGIDLNRFDQADRKDIRLELGLDGNHFVIGTVARLSPPKDLFTLVRAYANLRQSHPQADIRLLIVGDGELRSSLQQCVNEAGLSSEVVFTGARDDVPRLLGAMNVFVLASLSEGMPLTVLEAMASRLPVVASAVGALPDLVDDGVSGFLVEPENPRMLADRIAAFYNDKKMATAFGAAGRLRVERQFNSAIMIGKYSDLYSKIIN